MDYFTRTAMLLGSGAVDKMKGSRVAVFGIGGVGGYVAEGLVRAGLGCIDIIDNDVISPTNINRQIIAEADNIGMEKTAAMAQRIHRISPGCTVHEHCVLFMPETAHLFDFSQYDYVVDAIDTVTGKLCIIECAQKAGVPVISSMGTGNKLDPTAFKVTDIYHTSVCPLARVMRYESKKRGFAPYKVLYSEEKPMAPLFQPDEDTAKKTVPGSVSFVPPVAGLISAGEVIKDLTENIRQKL